MSPEERQQLIIDLRDRDMTQHGSGCFSMHIEAADEIARLEKALEDEHDMHMTMGSEVGANYREIGRLKEENEVLKQQYRALEAFNGMCIKSAAESEIIIKARHKEELEQLKVECVTLKAAAEVLAKKEQELKEESRMFIELNASQAQQLIDLKLEKIYDYDDKQREAKDASSS